MVEDVNEKIRECKNKVLLKESLKVRKISLEEILKDKREEKKELKERLSIEELQLKRLEKLSIYKIITKILNSKYTKLKEKEQEYIILNIRYKECITIIEGYEKEYKDIEKKIKDLKGIEEKYKILIDEKYKLLKKELLENKEIIKIDEERELLVKEKIELDEAIKQGEKCILIIRKIKENLEGAIRFGVYDILGGGFLSQTIKNSRIDDVEMELNGLIYIMDKFKEELNNINVNIPKSILEIDNFTYTLNLVFDKLFSDISLQGKMKSALKNIVNYNSEIEEINGVLKEREENIEFEIKDLDIRLNEIIEKI